MKLLFHRNQLAEGGRLSVFHLLLFLAISGLIVYTEGGPSAFLSLGKRKLVMVALAGV